MGKQFSRQGWLTMIVIILMPILFTFYLGTQMGYRQVADSIEAYRQIPEITRLADLTALSAGEIVMLQGQIAVTSSPAKAAESGLIIYQERPAAGREVRFQEEFSLIFADFTLTLPDGSLAVEPSHTREHIIQHELHQLPVGDRVLTGFQAGDRVMVQGQWQPGPTPALVDVTGVTGADRATLLAEWEAAMRKTRLLRDTLGGLSLLSLGLFIMQMRRLRKVANQAKEVEACLPQTPETMATTSAG
jgi:hypothetical protein